MTSVAKTMPHRRVSASVRLNAKIRLRGSLTFCVAWIGALTCLFTLNSTVSSADLHDLKNRSINPLHGFVPVFQDNAAPSSSLQFAHSDEYFTTSGDKGRIGMWSLKTGALLRIIRSNECETHVISHDSSYLKASSCANGESQVFRAQDGTLVDKVPDDAFPVLQEGTSYRERGHLNRELKSQIYSSMWTETGMLEAYSDQKDNYFRATFDDQRRYVAVLIFSDEALHYPEADRPIEIWDTISGVRVAELWLHTLCGSHVVSSLAVSSDKVVMTMTGGAANDSHSDLVLMQIQDGVGKLINASTCSQPGDARSAPALIAADGKYYAFQEYVGGPTRLYDLSTGHQLLKSPNDSWGVVRISADHKTIVAYNYLALRRSASPPTGFVWQRGARVGRFRANLRPERLNDDGSIDYFLDQDPIAISPHGKWIAWESSIGVFSSTQISKPSDHHASALHPKRLTGIPNIRIDDLGRLTVISDGYVLTSNRWKKVSDPTERISFRKPRFYLICNALICDTPRAGGVIVTKINLEHVSRLLRRDFSRLLAVSPDGHFLAVTTAEDEGERGTIDILDLLTSRRISSFEEPQIGISQAMFTDDNTCFVARGPTCFDIHSGKAKWHVRESNDGTGIVVTYSEGRIAFTPSLQSQFKLVKGFESRDLDDAAAAFIRKRH